jgi:hypothetical protein
VNSRGQGNKKHTSPVVPHCSATFQIPALCRVVSRREPVKVQALFGGGDGKGMGGNILENMKKAQQLVQTEALAVQEELRTCGPYLVVRPICKFRACKLP